MGVFDKVRLPLGIGRKNKFNFTPVTTTTQEFFSLRPVFSSEIMPNADVSVSHSYYVRASPLAKPMFGQARVVNRAFFVPYRVLMPAFNDFITDVDSPYNAVATRYSHVPYVKQSVLCDALINAGGATAGTSDLYDFIYYVEGTLNYGKFNEKGRNIYSILTGLGYSLSFGFQSEDDPANVNVSLMKLLAYFKIMADWYVSNNFPQRAVNINVQIDSIGRSLSVTTGQLAVLFSLACYSTLDNDYFTTASVNPVTPQTASGVTITDVSNDKTGSGGADNTRVVSRSSASSAYPTTPVLNGSNSSGTNLASASNITQYALNALEALTSYMQRNNIVGFKALDRFKARFGVELSADKLNRSYYLGSNSTTLNIDEVMSNADTTGAALGAYVGRADAGDRNNHFHFKSKDKEFGCLIILSTIIPVVHYGQGISRDNLHINRFDFFTPEFDALGMQAIARAELYNDAKTGANLSSLRTFAPQESFGFQHMYSEYAKMNDILSGDFRRRNTLDIRAFHIYRMFNEDQIEGSPNVVNYKTISENFLIGNPSEYNKMFNYTANDFDHFFSVHSFNIDIVQPKKRLFDSYEFHDDNSGAPITMPYKGTKLN